MVYMEYTTLDAFKVYFPNTGRSDELIGDFIARASRLLDAELGDNIGEQTITKRMDGFGKPRLIMENRINDVSLVQYTYRKTWIDVAVDFIDGPIVHLDSELPRGDSNVKVTYTKGYSSLPEDIQDFFHLYCGKLMDLDKNVQGTTQGEVKSKRINGLSVSYRTPSEIVEKETTDGGTFAGAFANILDKYKNFTLKVA